IAVFTDFEFSPPTVISLGRHWCAAPVAIARRAIQKLDRQRVVPVGENISVDMNNVAGDPFDRKSSTIDLWVHIFNDDSVLPIGRRSWLAVGLRHSDTRSQTVCLRTYYYLLPAQPAKSRLPSIMPTRCVNTSIKMEYLRSAVLGPL